MMRATAPARPSKLRGRLTILLVILACLGVILSGVAIWLHNALLDTDTWVEIATPVIDDPAVQADVAEFVGREVVTALEVESRLEAALPDQVSMLAAPLASGVQDVITKQTQEIVASDSAREVWIEANRVAHEKIVELLRGEAGVVYAEGDEIRLNLLPVVSRVVSELRLQFPRLFPGMVTVPAVTPETPAPEAIAQFEAAVGRDLADDFGQIILMQNEKLEQAQRAVELFDRAVLLLVIVTIGLIAAALLLSTRRLRTALYLGAGTAIALGVVLLVNSWLEEQLVAAIGDGPGTATARATIGTVLTDFTGFSRMLLLAAVVVAAAAYVVARRDVVAAAARSGAAVATRAGSGLAGRRSRSGVLARHLDGFRLAGVLVGAVLLLITLPPWWGGLLLIAAVAGYELLLSWLTHTWPWSLNEPERDAPA
ncbi:MAG: hypothetical protein JW767_07735 [Thermoleophilia bacterium]|nr:hypothetical protein [Thermoleophilia bacterium]